MLFPSRFILDKTRLELSVVEESDNNQINTQISNYTIIQINSIIAMTSANSGMKGIHRETYPSLGKHLWEGRCLGGSDVPAETYEDNWNAFSKANRASEWEQVLKRGNNIHRLWGNRSWQSSN
jgi:hypothetical protein